MGLAKNIFILSLIGSCIVLSYGRLVLQEVEPVGPKDYINFRPCGGTGETIDLMVEGCDQTSSTCFFQNDVLYEMAIIFKAGFTSVQLRYQVFVQTSGGNPIQIMDQVAQGQVEAGRTYNATGTVSLRNFGNTEGEMTLQIWDSARNQKAACGEFSAFIMEL